MFFHTSGNYKNTQYGKLPESHILQILFHGYRRRFSRKIKHVSGFTLTEIMVTIIIVSVLASVALPRFTGVIERVRAVEWVQIWTALLGAQKAYEAEHGNYSAILADLDIEIDRAANFNLPPTVVAPDPDDLNADPVAAITRTGSYTLDIDEDGDIGCTNWSVLFTFSQSGYWSHLWIILVLNEISW